MALSIRNSLHGTINKYKILVLQDTIDISGTLFPSGTIIVMGGTGTANLAYTVNGGTSWTAVSLFSTSGQAIAYGLQRLVAVGQGGNTLITSANGTTWTTVVSPFSTIGYDVLCDGSKWIGVGQGGATLAYSGTGGSWTSVSGIFTTAGYGLLYDSANQLYFAAGEGGNTLATSSDGVIWTGSSPLTTRAYGVGGPATYSGGQTVAIGGWVAVATNNTLIAVSDDGTSWSSNNASNATISTDSVAYGMDGSFNPVWLVGSNASNPNNMCYSYNRTTWTRISISNIGASNTKQVAYSLDNMGNPLWISMAGAYIIKSSNMFDWSGLTTTFSITTVLQIRWFQRPTGNIWFIVGAGTYNIAYSTDISYGSTNANWTFVTPKFFSSAARCIDYGLDGAGSELFIVGGNGGNNYAKSSNGINWTSYTTALMTTIYTIGFGKDGANNNLWVAGGAGSNTIMISPDGTNWTGKGMVFSTACYSLKYANNIWVAIGVATYTIAYSTNGSNWTTVVSSTSILPISNIPVQVTYGSTTYTKPKYLSAGQGNQTLMGSTDGTTWYALPSPFTTAAKSVAWSATLSRWVAVGEGTNTIAWSDDGVNWTGLGTTYFATRGNKVKYDSATSKFYAVGEGTNRLVSSSDGKTWTAISTTGAVTTAGIGVCLV